VHYFIGKKDRSFKQQSQHERIAWPDINGHPAAILDDAKAGVPGIIKELVNQYMLQLSAKRSENACRGIVCQWAWRLITLETPIER
jgi:hypothetical protein